MSKIILLAIALTFCATAVQKSTIVVKADTSTVVKQD